MIDSHLKSAPARRAMALVADGIAALLAGRAEDAVAPLQRALGIQKANPEAYYYLARALNQLGDATLARETLALASQRLPAIFDHREERFGLYPPFDLALDDPDFADALNSNEQLSQGIELIDQGHWEGAVDRLVAALEANPWNLTAYYHLAQALANQGEDEKAQRVLEKAIEDFPFAFGRASRFGEFQGFGLDAPTTKAYYRALARTFGDINGFLDPCPRTGRAGPALDPATEKFLAGKFEESQSQWRNGEIPLPAGAAGLAAGAPPSSTAGASSGAMLLVAPRYIKCNPDWVDYDAAYHLAGTGRAAFAEFHIHHADRFHSEGDQLVEPRSPDELSAGMEALATHIARLRPRYIFFDGNFLGGRQGISARHLAELKARFAFRLAIMVGDIYPPKPNYAAYWSTAADVIVALNEHPYLVAARQNCRVLVWPGITADTALMDGVEVPSRDLGVLFVGSRKGYRDLWCAHLEDAGLPVRRHFTDQSRANSVGTEEYLRLLKRARLVFNSALVSSREQQQNFRIFEAFAARAPLLQHDFPGMRDYFVPYLHYAPFANTDEMISTARFLLKRRDLAETIAEEAFAWYRERFAGPHFWRRLVAELDAVGA